MNTSTVAQVLQKKDGKTGTIYLYGQIGQTGINYEEFQQEGLTDVDVVKAVSQLKKEGCERLNVRINSPGGSIMQGDGIMAALKNSEMELHTYCDGVAASYAASLFLCANKENRHMAKNGKLMLHDPRNMVYGNAKTLRTEADNLEVFASASISQIAADTGMGEEEIRQKYFDGEDHWMDAKTAAAIGLIEQVEDYETEADIPNAEQMTHPQLVQFFAQTGKIEKNIFSKVMDKVRQQIGTFSNQNLEIVNIETIKAAIQSGEVSVEDLTQLAQEQTATPPPTPEAPTALSAEAVQQMITDALTPVQAENTALKAEIEALKKAPGAAPSQVSTPNGEPGDHALTPLQQAYQADLEAGAKAAQNWDNPFARKNRR